MPGCIQVLSSPARRAGIWPRSSSTVAGVLTVRGRPGPSKPEKSSLLTSRPPAMFLLREEERGARDVNMCQLMEHTVDNVIVPVYVCVERL